MLGTSIDAIVETVRQGAGIAALLENVLRNGDLVRVATDSQGPDQPVFLVYHRELRRQPHVRAAVASIETYMRGLC
jgi:DNA-binding transcriptional LysR family regulator